MFFKVIQTWHHTTKRLSKRFQNWFTITCINDEMIYKSNSLSLSHLLSDLKKTWHRKLLSH